MSDGRQRRIGVGEHAPIQLANETPDGKDHLVEHVKVLAACRITVDGVAIVSITVVEQVLHELVRRALAPVMNVEISGLGEAIREQVAGKGLEFREEPDDVVAVSLGRAAIHQQDRFAIFLQRVDGESEKISVQALDRAPPRGDVVFIGSANEQFAREIVLRCADAHGIFPSDTSCPASSLSARRSVANTASKPNTAGTFSPLIG